VRRVKPNACKRGRKRYAPRLVIMVKDARAGNVKSRLARQTGVAQAVRVYRAMAGALIARLGADPRWQTILAVSPDHASRSRALPNAVARMPQGGGDLGRKLQRVADRAPLGPLLIVGTDIPGISAEHVAAAFRALKNADAVVGPASDGGYWLIGLRRMPVTPQPFQGVRWSSPDARADTIANLPGKRVALSTALDDIDEAHDLRRLGHLVGRRVLPRG
jgi:uncharacterized protein